MLTLAVTPVSLNIIIVVRNVISVSKITNIWDHSFRVFCQSQDPQLLAPCLRHKQRPTWNWIYHLENGQFFIQNIFSVQNYVCYWEIFGLASPISAAPLSIHREEQSIESRVQVVRQLH